MKNFPAGNWLRTSMKGLYVAALIILLLGMREANAAYLMTIGEVGNDVVATGGGTLNISALFFGGTSSVSAEIQANQAIVITGLPSTGLFLSGIFGPDSSFGSGNEVAATTASGQSVGVDRAELLIVPDGYASNTPLSSSATWNNQTLSSLGLNAGTYTYSWGSGPSADTFTVQIVPEPSTWIAASLLVLGVGIRQWRGRKTKQLAA
jgi:hypothetical protein